MSTKLALVSPAPHEESAGCSLRSLCLRTFASLCCMFLNSLTLLQFPVLKGGLIETAVGPRLNVQDFARLIRIQIRSRIIATLDFFGPFSFFKT